MQLRKALAPTEDLPILFLSLPVKIAGTSTYTGPAAQQQPAGAGGSDVGSSDSRWGNVTAWAAGSDRYKECRALQLVKEHIQVYYGPNKDINLTSIAYLKGGDLNLG